MSFCPICEKIVTQNFVVLHATGNNDLNCRLAAIQRLYVAFSPEPCVVFRRFTGTHRVSGRSFSNGHGAQRFELLYRETIHMDYQRISSLLFLGTGEKVVLQVPS
jgi:hypothetical protein